MALQTHSRFYLGLDITIDNSSLDFSEGGGELQATLSVGNYTFEELAIELKTQLDNAGALTYTVTTNRQTRSFTVSATGTFELLITTGTRIGTSAYSLIGFTGADLTGASSYKSNTSIGTEYVTQYRLQSYVPSSNFKSASDASVNKTASGRVEVFSFGQEKFLEMRFNYLTDIAQDPENQLIRNRPTGVQDFRDFMDYAITKGKIQFMPDENDFNTYEKIILESSAGNRDGTGFKMKELFDRGLFDYFDSGLLTFRVVV